MTSVFLVVSVGLYMPSRCEYACTWLMHMAHAHGSCHDHGKYNLQDQSDT